MTKENTALEGKLKKKNQDQGRAVLPKEEKTGGNMRHLHGCKNRGVTRKENK